MALGSGRIACGRMTREETLLGLKCVWVFNEFSSRDDAQGASTAAAVEEPHTATFRKADP